MSVTGFHFHGGLNTVLVEIALIAAALAGMAVIARWVQASYRKARSIAEMGQTLAEIALHFAPDHGTSLLDIATDLRRTMRDLTGEVSRLDHRMERLERTIEQRQRRVRAGDRRSRVVQPRTVP